VKRPTWEIAENRLRYGKRKAPKERRNENGLIVYSGIVGDNATPFAITPCARSSGVSSDKINANTLPSVKRASHRNDLY